MYLTNNHHALQVEGMNSNIFIAVKNYESVSQCVVLDLVPLRGEKNYWSHAHKTGSLYLLGVHFKMSDEQPRPFYWEVYYLPQFRFLRQIPN